jgi:predicted RNA-binding Zn ribbon-like protein
MDHTAIRGRTFEFSGGRLCLDFANTVDARPTDHALDRLATYADLVAWSQQADIISAHEAHHLLRKATDRPGDVAVIFTRAIALREAIYRIFSALAGGHRPRANDVATLNAELSAAMRRIRIVPTGGGFAWAWTCDDEALDRMCWPVVRSAAEFLTSDARVTGRECAGLHCGWLFIDTSRNQSRRWCNMQVCGNRAKARRHYQRKKGGRTRA